MDREFTTRMFQQAASKGLFSDTFSSELKTRGPFGYRFFGHASSIKPAPSALGHRPNPMPRAVSGCQDQDH
jgi:hypothetical protein